ncbi:hypothetical protein DRO91_10095, partial [Candidatus Heimdallarchaeota archaeon]
TRSRSDGLRVKGRREREKRIKNGKARWCDARLIAARALGRKLKKKEVVHHIDKNKKNNRNDNLLICTLEYHGWLHVEMKRKWYRETYGPKMKRLWKKGYSPTMIADEIPELGKRMVQKILSEYLGLRRTQSEAQKLRFKRENN